MGDLAESIASAAEAFHGTPYLWGGYLPKTGWDCSGFANYILGEAFGITLPGGFKWTGTSHGPVTGQYLVWSGAKTTTSPSAGTLCCWETHMGIAISSTQMISALNPALGTQVTSFAGGAPSGEVLVFRDVTAAGDGGSGATLTSDTTTPGAAGGCLSGLLLMPAYLAAALIRKAWS